MEMDSDYKPSPTKIHRLPVVEVGNRIKKRKLQAEQLDLPTSKHKCWDVNFPHDEHVSMMDENPDQVQNMQKRIVKRNIEGVINDESGPGSGKGSNSFAGDYYDSAMSVYSEAELNPAHAKSVYDDKPSTSSVDCNVNILKVSGSSVDSLSAMEANYNEADMEFVNLEVHQPIQNFEEQLREYEGEASYICSEYGHHFLEECTDKEVEDIIYSDPLNPHSYILSSGRWSLNQEAQSGGNRKPTIDQEFEQYFSSLML